MTEGLDHAEWDTAAGSGVTLERLLSVVGSGALELDTAPGGLAVVVGGVTVLDVLAPEVRPRELVLAVGVAAGSAQAVDVVRRAGAARAAGVVFGPDRPEGTGGALRDAAHEAGTAVLFRTWYRWEELVAVLRAGLAAAGVVPPPSARGLVLGDLDGLADAVAALVGGSVTIEDTASRVLAYSSTEENVDEMRRLTILGRRVPPWRVAAMRDAGFFRALWTTDDVLHRRAQGESPERLVCAVRAGGEVLGSVWVAAVAGRPLSPNAAEALRAASRAAAAHLLHHRTRGADSRLVEDAARALLEGRGSAEVLAERAALPTREPCAVLAVGVATGIPTPSPSGGPAGSGTTTPGPAPSGTPARSRTGPPGPGPSGAPVEGGTGTPAGGEAGSLGSGTSGTPTRDRTGTPGPEPSAAPVGSGTGTPAGTEADAVHSGTSGTPTRGPTGTPGPGPSSAPAEGRTGASGSDTSTAPARGRTGAPGPGRSAAPVGSGAAAPAASGAAAPVGSGAGTPGQGPFGDPARMYALLALHCAALGHRAVLVPAGGRALVLVSALDPDPGAARAQVAKLGTSLTARLSATTGAPVRAGLGEVVPVLGRAAESRRTAEQALKALVWTGGARAVAWAGDVADTIGVLQVLDALRDVELPPGTSVARLAAFDAEHTGSRLVESLRAYLDHFGDVSAAARSLSLHPNSLRYRLGRIAAVSGLDLDDADARLLAQLQLRLGPGEPERGSGRGA
ncbi:helix-turn-helix domain-containing protein [Streptomyces sp. NPDC012751]|uniref:helix-turn-helix domain-containing protein n=1 Tax=Streptomyces sp. NPDC012751 TaxID=3364846 RepID=UPI003679983F